MNAEVIPLNLTQEYEELFKDVPPVMSPKTLGTMIEVSVATLCRWRRDGIGPEPIEPNRTNMIRYAKCDVIKWLWESKLATRKRGH